MNKNIYFPIITVITGLLSGCGDTLESADATNSEAVRLGQIIYADHCAECHGINLEGQPNWRSPKEDGMLPAPPHDDSGHTWHHDDQLLFNYTKGGGAAIAPKGFKSGMPAYGEILSDQQIWQVLSYIKSRWSPQAQERQAQMNK
ncbi:MAG: cytochrome c [Magnetovibrio sp.]|nr:cytochrome c [Magnetovibrio sp.]